MVVYSDTEPHPFDFAQFEERLRRSDLLMNSNEPMNMDQPIGRFIENACRSPCRDF
jgi:hypothetical protein